MPLLQLISRLIGAGDIAFGNASFSYVDENGVVRTMSEVNATQIPTSWGQSVDEAIKSSGSWVWLSDGASLATAVAAAGATSTLIYLTPGTYTVPDNLTVPTNITLVAERGADVQVATTKTLTINGPFRADLYKCFTLVGTGAVSFGVGSITEVNAIWFGNDTAAIQGTFNAAPSGATIRFNAGSAYTYSPSATFEVVGKNLRLVCDPGVEIDATGLTCSFPLRLTGTEGTFYALGASVSEGAVSLTTDATLVATLSNGDLIRITTDSTKGGGGTLWCPAGISPTYWKGEFAEVLSASGTTVNLKGRLCDSYSVGGGGSDNPVISKVSPITVVLDGFRMKGLVSVAAIGVDLEYTRDAIVTGNTNIHGFGYCCLQNYYGYNTVVDGYVASDFAGGVGTDYGIMFASCQIARIVNSKIVGGRHAVTSGGKEPCRYITIGPDNYLENNYTSGALAVAPHENTEHFLVVGNKVKGGIDLSGKSARATNNYVVVPEPAFFGLRAWINQDADYMIFEDNVVVSPDAYDHSATYIAVVALRNGSTAKHVKFSGNAFRGMSGGWFIYNDSATNDFIDILELYNNRVDLTSNVGGTTGYPLKCVSYDGTHMLTINRLILRGNNWKYESPNYGLYFAAYVNGTDWLFDGDELYYNGATNGNVPLLVDNTCVVARIMCRGLHNRFGAHTQSNYNLTATAFIEFVDNYLSGLTANGGAVLNAGSGDILIRGNQQASCTGNYNLTGRHFYSVVDTGIIDTWGSGTPEGAVTAPPSSTYKNTSGAGGEYIRYIKKTGAGNTGWVGDGPTY